METQLQLKEAGLTDQEAIVYISALELGETSMTELAKKAKMKRSTTYLVVDELLKKGLISDTIVGKRNIYSPAPPNRLLESIRLKEIQLEQLLPYLNELYNKPKHKPNIQVFKGEQGVVALYKELYDSLSNKEEALWFVRVDALKKYFPKAIAEYKRVLRKLDNPKIRELCYGNEEGKTWSDEFKRIKGRNHYFRITPSTYEFGFTDNLIFKNKIVIFSLKEDVFVTVIESEDIAKTYRAMFEMVWKSARVV